MNGLLHHAFLAVLLGLPLALPADDFAKTLDQAETLRTQGHYHQALDRLQAAKPQTAEQQAQLAGALGHACYLAHQQPYCNQDTLAQLRTAAEAGSLPPARRSVYANLLGNLYLRRHNPQAAALAYRSAVDLAEGKPVWS